MGIDIVSFLGLINVCSLSTEGRPNLNFLSSPNPRQCLLLTKALTSGKKVCYEKREIASEYLDQGLPDSSSPRQSYFRILVRDKRCSNGWRYVLGKESWITYVPEVFLELFEELDSGN